MRSPAELVDAFRASGHKVTPQRERIFHVLFENPSHPTAEAVHAAVVADMPSVSLRTVYSTLQQLAEMGELHQLDLGTGSARFDPNTADHHHLVCDRCGRVQDIELAVPRFALDDDTLDGFHVGETQIVFRGRCARCAPAEAPRPDPGTSVHPPSNHQGDTHG